MLHEELAEPTEAVIRSYAAIHVDRETFPGILVHNGQPFQRSAVLCPDGDEVVGSTMSAVGGSMPHTGAIGEPQSAALQLLLRHLQAFPPPDPFHAFD